MRAPRNRRWLLAQIIVTGVVVVSIARALVGQWQTFRNTPLVTDVHWTLILGSAGVVLLTYGVQIETWRRMVIACGESLAVVDAIRITCISKLGLYVPGRVWQVGAMGVLAQRTGVSPSAAAGSAIVSTAANIAVGFAVAVLAGWRVFDLLSGGHAKLGLAVAAAALAGVVALPVLMPRALGAARRATGREFVAGTFPARAVYLAIVGNAVAWLMYGMAFQVFVAGVLGASRGRTLDYVAAYAGSYVVGYLAFLVPGGLVVREGALVRSLTAMALADPKQAAVIAVTSRLWLSVLEIVPGLYFWARHRAPRSEETHPLDGPQG